MLEVVADQVGLEEFNELLVQDTGLVPCEAAVLVEDGCERPALHLS